MASIAFVVLKPRANYLLQPLCRWGITVNLTALVGALIQFQRLPAGIRQGLRAQLLAFHQRQRLFLFLPGTPPADPNKTHLGCVVLEVEDARLTLLELLDHQDVLVALDGNTGFLVLLVDPGAVLELDRRRREPLGVVWRAQPRVCQHGYPRPRTFLAADPGGGLDEFAVLVLLGVLTQQPHVPRFVLRKEGELRLAQLARGVVPLPDDEGPHAVDPLAKVGDSGDDPTRRASLLPFRDGRPLVGELSPWL